MNSPAADPFGGPSPISPVGPPPLPQTPSQPASPSWSQEPAPNWSSPTPSYAPAKSGMSTGAKVAIGVGVGFVVVVGLILVAVFSVFRTVTESGEFQAVFNDFATWSDVSVDYRTGTCFERGDRLVETPCSDPHSYEVFALVAWDSSTYPDYDEAWSTVFCEDAFEGYVGIDYLDSDFFYEIALPSREAWDAGDQNVRCIGYDPGTLLTRSIRGAAY